MAGKWYCCPDCDYKTYDSDKFKEHYEENHKTPAEPGLLAAINQYKREKYTDKDEKDNAQN